MPRAARVLVDGAYYHVYNRLARGERMFSEEPHVRRFVSLLRETLARDEITVLAWVVMPTHYHLAVHTGRVPLNRPIASVQQRMATTCNASQKVHGPLWQGRYRAKIIESDGYLHQLLAYIHLNPVVAGLVDDPAAYRWSGHREILEDRRDSIVDASHVLRLFGSTRTTARAAYRDALVGAGSEIWVDQRPGKLPWWRLGRPPSASAVSDEFDGTLRDDGEAGEQRTDDDRPAVRVEELLRLVAPLLAVTVDDLVGRGRGAEVVRAREVLAVLAVEHYGLRVKDVASALAKHPVTATGWVMRGLRRRREDPATAARLDELDARLRKALRS